MKNAITEALEKVTQLRGVEGFEKTYVIPEVVSPIFTSMAIYPFLDIYNKNTISNN